MISNLFAEFNELKSKVDWMEKSIDLASKRYNEIGKSLNIPIIDLCCTDNEKQNVEFTINFMSKQKKQEIVS